MMDSVGIIRSHPDLLHFREGVIAYNKKDFKKARRSFHLSGLYGDKSSQAMLAEMNWKGEGGPVDRPRAYALMDIAAERATNPDLLNIREKYWEAMTEAERQKAVALGDDIVSKYSDDAALKKLAIAFRTDRLSRIRVPPGRLQSVLIHGDDGNDENLNAEEVNPSHFYASKFWEPKEYMQMRDDVTNRMIRNGRVKVKFGGAVEDVNGKIKIVPKSKN